jgi:hypothetical protein
MTITGIFQSIENRLQAGAAAGADTEAIQNMK